MSNVKTVQDIYAAFGAGEIPTILAKLADDVDWGYGGASADGVPWLQHRRGPGEVAGFFESISALEFHAFAPKEILDGGNVVVALIDVDFTVTATKQRITEEDEIHVWRFNDAGKIVRFRHGANTHRHYSAFHP
jgi:ketosteroid isomerase-like protein